MIDFHCHLDLYPDPASVVSECRRRDLYVLSVTTTPSAFSGTKELAAEASRIRTAVGLHPQLARERRGELPLFDKLLSKTRYVGEVGLDGSPDLRSQWPDQVAVFDHILRACHDAGGKVLSIHSRRAAREVLDRLAEVPDVGTPILHWFSGSASELKRAIGLDCWFSVGPAMMASNKGRELIKQMPRDRVLTESDGPFAQIDGSPVLPWQAADCGPLAELWSTTRDEAQVLVLDNLRSLVTDPKRKRA